MNVTPLIDVLLCCSSSSSRAARPQKGVASTCRSDHSRVLVPMSWFLSRRLHRDHRYESQSECKSRTLRPPSEIFETRRQTLFSSALLVHYGGSLRSSTRVGRWVESLPRHRKCMRRKRQRRPKTYPQYPLDTNGGPAGGPPLFLPEPVVTRRSDYCRPSCCCGSVGAAPLICFLRTPRLLQDPLVLVEHSFAWRMRSYRACWRSRGS